MLAYSKHSAAKTGDVPRSARPPQTVPLHAARESSGRVGAEGDFRAIGLFRSGSARLPGTLAGSVQAKTRVGEAGDAQEQEADRAADRVMRMATPGALGLAPGGVLQRACSAREEKDAASPVSVQRRAAGPSGHASAPPVTPAMEGDLHALRGGGAPLPHAIRAFMEPRFAADFRDVRVHADGRAGDLARRLGARAFTLGSDIVFAPGEFRPRSSEGARLVAHELAHVIQQDAAAAGPVVQREPDPAQPDAHGAGTRAKSQDPRVDDPNFLLCLALCELGIPPSAWRTIFSLVLQAGSEEFRGRLGELRGSQEFEQWRAEISAMSTFNKVKLAVTFLAGEGVVARTALRIPAAQAIRRLLLEQLARLGAREGAVLVASQIIRKVAAFIELGIAAGCGLYCGATALATSLVDVMESAAEGIVSFVSTLQAGGGAIAGFVGHALLKARVSMDPSNWSLTGLPSRAQAHLNAIGLAFRLAVTPDTFLSDMARPLGSFPVGSILGELAVDINAALQSRGGFAAVGATFSADFLGRLTPLGLVDILKDYGLLTFVEDPDVVANRQAAGQPVGATQP